MASARGVAPSGPLTTPRGPLTARPLPPGAVCATEAPWQLFGLLPPRALSHHAPWPKQRSASVNGSPEDQPRWQNNGHGTHRDRGRGARNLRRGSRSASDGSRPQRERLEAKPPKWDEVPAAELKRRLRHGGALATARGLAPSGPLTTPRGPLTAREICGAGRGAPATDPARSKEGLKRGPELKRTGPAGQKA